MYYLICESLTPCEQADIRNTQAQYVAVLTQAEWRTQREDFRMGIDLEMDLSAPRETKAMVNLDSLTGTLCIPDRDNISAQAHSFAFALDERGVVLVDDTGYALELTQRLAKSKKWRLPSLERFLYDLLELTIAQDLGLLEKMEQQLENMEEAILQGSVERYPTQMNDIRGDLLDLRLHYEQLIDLGQELEENENGFFRDKKLRYFRLSMSRLDRLRDLSNSLRDHTMQLRDLYHTQLEAKQNRIMTLLTVVTTIFMPLTLITGWYGMNFRYMPELDKPWAYPAVIAVSVLIAAGCLIFFKKKKWM